MKIVITNTVALNGGDAAILMALLHLIRRALGADTEVVVYDSAPDVARRHYPGIDFRMLLHQRAGLVPLKPLRRVVRGARLAKLKLAARLLRTNPAMSRRLLSAQERADLETYASADAIISTGGTYLVEHYSIEARVFDYQLALALGKTLVFFTQSLGPFRKRRNRRRLARIFALARLILLRDERSLRTVQELAPGHPAAHVVSDGVFALADEGTLERARSRPPVAGGRPKVVVSVRRWHRFRTISSGEGMRRFKSVVGAAVTELVRARSAEVTFLSTCQGIPEYGFDDSSVAAEIAGALPDDVRPHVQVEKGFHSPEQLVALLSGFDFAISTRLHLAILALVAGTPVFPVAYEFKTHELFTKLGMGEYVQDIERLDPETFVGQLRLFVERLASIRNEVFPKVGAERGSALRSGGLLAAALGRPADRVAVNRSMAP
jgi:colanic acid/amylovoran biosynthesis protein